MSATLYKNSFDCGEMLAFRDAAGRISHVHKEDMNSELATIYSNPEVLSVMNDSIDDYLDGRFTDFEI
ncbi:hypothetical protein HMPREF3011_08910 [Corynebacterium sp. HMSC074C04]|uniref:hypothetical protein n=1 Tax=unclassified Corynebacterium TaxID=2624378 RepID=UPI0008A58622|nr:MULTISPECIES: hypothetical protein [unclassified Corynebacterium]OFR92565.1 hypothetical protein HMPREF2860_07520 [Corynebacterium sp. HMSC064E10]OHR31933.1 hypothetical protein HMPREF3011_08910 [Corynebacterium sp. HMSC074C04]